MKVQPIVSMKTRSILEFGYILPDQLLWKLCQVGCIDLTQTEAKGRESKNVEKCFRRVEVLHVEYVHHHFRIVSSYIITNHSRNEVLFPLPAFPLGLTFLIVPCYNPISTSRAAGRAVLILLHDAKETKAEGNACTVKDGRELPFHQEYHRMRRRNRSRRRTRFLSNVKSPLHHIHLLVAEH